MIKRNIVSNITILLLFLFLVASIIDFSILLSDYSSYLSEYEEIQLSFGLSIDNEFISLYKSKILKYSFYVAFNSIALIACAFLFIYVNPRLFRKSTYTSLADEWEKNKTERAAIKQARDEEAKQKRIEELQNELDELKKD